MSKKTIAITILSIPVLLYAGLVIGYNFETSHKKTPVAAAAQSTPTPQPPTRAELLQLVNAERAKYNVAPLQENVALDQAAQAKAEDEVVHGFGHYCGGCMNGMDKSHVTLGLPGTYGENLTDNVNTNDAQSAFQAWVNSPEHLKNMVDPNFTLTGFGISGTQIVEEFYKQ